jgi:2',3'-cyclic-nucleotide 2'-phosphodiesterase (5'-nucleotidase family)
MNILTPRYGRRAFLRQLGGGTLASALPWRALAGDDDLVTVSILNTTDLHGHIVPTQTYADKDGKVTGDVGGLARCATQIQAWKAENPHHLLFDIGDVYQGTHVSLSTRGQLMVRLLNSMNYDAWVIGNHEFDWGPEPLADAVKMSTPTVLGSNAKVDGVYANMLKDQAHPLAKIKPYLIKEVAGFKIGIIGSITPGLPAWSAPRLLGGFEAAPPVRSVHYALARMKKEGVDAVIVAAHMGLKGVGVPDDFANRINEIAKEVEGVHAIIAGHTHREIPSLKLGEVVYTQAGYYGIQCGRMDLVFSKSTRKLVAINPSTKLMDASVAQDPAILSASARERQASDAEWARSIGELKQDLTKDSLPGRPAQTLLLLTRAIRHALEERKVPVDGVLHGNFLETGIKAGRKTIGDAWEVVPYENHLCTAGFTHEDLLAALTEVFNSKMSTHNLDGFKVTVTKSGRKWQATGITLPDGKPLDPERRYRIALNSYDAQSGGRRYEILNQIATSAEAKQEFFPVQSREALIGYFTARQSITHADLGIA